MVSLKKALIRAQLLCSVRPFVPVFSATKVLAQLMIAGVAAVATRSMRLVAFTELFTSLHRMLSPSCWFVALLLSGGICHPKEMKAGSWSFLDIHIVYIHLLFMFSLGFWMFPTLGFPAFSRSMERNHLGLAMVLGHSTSSNCIFNYIIVFPQTVYCGVYS